jgi:ubiquinone/menaquinone biosynthesis C-methylase UbiE
MLTYLLLICVILAIVVSFSFLKKKDKIRPTLVIKTNSDIYDSEYATMYDSVTYDVRRLNMDVSHIMETTNNSSSILDVGSGTGHHVHELNKKGVTAIGIDNSSAMIKHSKKYPHRYFQGNALHMTLFHEETFSHIMCLYYTFYYFKNKDQFLQNVYKWLIPGGYFFVHLSDKCNYGTAKLVDKEFTYKTVVKPNQVHEIIKRDNVIRRNEHTFYMENIPFILQLLDQAGFQFISSYNYDFQNFLYVFQKLE